MCTFFIHRLRYDRQTARLPGARQQLEAFLAQSLKGIRRATRFECASAERSPTGGLHYSRSRENLLFGFNRAWAANHDHTVTANHNAVPEVDDSVVRPPLARDLLVRLGDVNDLRDTGQCLEPRSIDAPVVSDETDRGPLRPRHRPRLVPHFLDDTYHAIDVFRRRVVLHDN